jgi:hypothetical protein
LPDGCAAAFQGCKKQLKQQLKQQLKELAETEQINQQKIIK